MYPNRTCILDALTGRCILSVSCVSCMYSCVMYPKSYPTCILLVSYSYPDTTGIRPAEKSGASQRKGKKKEEAEEAAAASPAAQSKSAEKRKRRQR